MTILPDDFRSSPISNDECPDKQEILHWKKLVTFAKLVAVTFGAVSVLARSWFDELSATMFDEIIDRLDIFQGMDAAQRRLLQKYFHVCNCAGDEVVFEQGDPATKLFILVEGAVVVRFKPEDAPELIVTRIKEGGVFGWSAAFGSGYYTSGAVCTSPSVLLSVGGSALKMLRENHPETGILILERLAAVVAERMQGSPAHAQLFAFLEDGLINGVKPIGG